MAFAHDIISVQSRGSTQEQFLYEADIYIVRVNKDGIIFPQREWNFDFQ